MNLVFLGPPGAGKGTQAANVTAALGILHISTGDMFRSAIRDETPTGLKAKSYIDKGELVPDSVTIEMVKERLAKPDAAKGYLLDGFPRTAEQAAALEEIWAPDAVINIEVDDSKLIDRLTGRRICESCKGTFHISMLEDENVCPVCGNKLIQRKDDQIETITQRLKVYHHDTEQLVSYYSRLGKLKIINGEATPEEVQNQIFSALREDL